MLTMRRGLCLVWQSAVAVAGPSHPTNRIVAVKVYPSLTHVVKGLATANFTRLPETVQLARKRRSSQAAQLLWEMRFKDYSCEVGKIRIEVIMKLQVALSHSYRWPARSGGM